MSKTKVYLAGHTGMVGSATYNQLVLGGKYELLTSSPTDDLRCQQTVNALINAIRPDSIVIAAAKVGGILANMKYPYDFIYDNLMIEANIINAAIFHGVKKLIYLGSSCIYPKLSMQPLKEEYLLTGSLEATNEWYAIAKIAGIKLCQAANLQYGVNFVSLMPTNLYGERDNFDLESSHVLPAMIRKFHEGLPNKDVVLWGSGAPMREFMHVSDLSNAICFALESVLPGDIFNVGTGMDISIKNLALLVQRVVGHTGRIVWDESKPDGTPRKLLDISKLHSLGWGHRIDLDEGLRSTYQWFLSNKDSLREVKHGI